MHRFHGEGFGILGAFVFGFGATVAIGYVKSQTRLKEDAVIGVIFNRVSTTNSYYGGRRVYAKYYGQDQKKKRRWRNSEERDQSEE